MAGMHLPMLGTPWKSIGRMDLLDGISGRIIENNNQGKHIYHDDITNETARTIQPARGFIQ
jgi:hypothetical protein